MNLFHTHYFKPSEKDPEMLYCHCGQVKDIHRHIWEVKGNIINDQIKVLGFVLKCRICGEIKNYNIVINK